MVMAERQTPHTRFIQCRLPADLYEWMRLRGFLLRKSMNSIVLSAVGEYREAIESGQATPSADQRGTSGDTVKYNVRVDDDLYEWLRTTAFYARLSINTLVATSLVRYHAAHEHENERSGAVAV